MNNENEIALTLVELIKKNFGFVGEISEELYETPLTAKPFRLAGIDLYVLLLVVEEKFQVYFQPNIIRKWKFNSVREIQNLICMEKKIPVTQSS